MRKNLAQYLADHPDCEVFTKQIARRYRKKMDFPFDGPKKSAFLSNLSLGNQPPDGEQQYEFDPNYDPQYDQQSLGNMYGAAYGYPSYPGLPPGKLLFVINVDHR